MDEFVMSAAESVLAGAMDGIAVTAGERALGGVEPMEGRIVWGGVETMMHYMGGVGGLGVGGATKD
jgi:hypothetical protein